MTSVLFLDSLFNHYMFFSSCMWPNSSSGSPSSETRSMQPCKMSFRLWLELEQSKDPEPGFCCCWGQSWSIFSPPLQQAVSLHPPPQQSESGWFTSRSSMLSDTEVTLGGGFSRAFLIPSRIVSSYWQTRCRRSVTEAGMGLSGRWIWHQQDIALWHKQRGHNVTNNSREEWLGQKSL